MAQQILHNRFPAILRQIRTGCQDGSLTVDSMIDCIVRKKRDIDMPGMPGVVLYARATAADEDIGGRFLFFSRRLEPQVEQSLRDGNLPFGHQRAAHRHPDEKRLIAIPHGREEVPF